jgi:hypothetical protein
MDRKILYSPGYGAGWVSWEHDDDNRKLMLTYPPLVEAVERGDKITEAHPAIQSLLAEIKEAGRDEPYLCGIDQLRVYNATGRVIIDEYDGNESVTEEGTDLGWM